jgi:hypothetical protein
LMHALYAQSYTKLDISVSSFLLTFAELSPVVTRHLKIYFNMYLAHSVQCSVFRIVNGEMSCRVTHANCSRRTNSVTN